ncbi:MAG: hypothetical protein M9899_03860 [Bdellovibrionaceae bacterium]|nr:hypothetical protein [Pseudobdellovibrionaceae bacterium]
MTQKDNPLFQDSTISTGTNIRTQFELGKVFLYEGESVCLLLKDGKEQRVLGMRCIDAKTGTYTCSHWLKHRQEITYQFAIKNKEGVVFQSPIQKGLAMYTLLEVWEPCLDEDQVVMADLCETLIEDVQEEVEASGEPEDVIGNLIDKWGL